MPRHSRPDGSDWPSVLLIVGAGIVSALQVGKGPVALAAVQADLRLDLATVSWLVSAFAVVGALAGAPIGLAADRAGTRRLLVGGLVLQALASALGAMSSTAAALLLTRGLEGLGFLAVVVAAPAMLVAMVPPADRDRAVALWATFMPVGMTLALLATPLLTLLQWRAFWLLNAAILLVYALAFARLAPSPAEHHERRSLAKDLGEATAAATTWGLAGLFAAFSAAFFAVFTFLPAFLAERLEVSPDVAGILTAIAIAVSGIGNLVCGQLLARGISPRPLLIASFGVMALCAFGILGGGAPGPLVYALAVAFAFVSGLPPVVIIGSAPNMAPRPDLGGVTVGFAMQGNNIGMLIGPAAAGGIAASLGWPSVVLPVTAFCVAGAVLAARMFGRAYSASSGVASISRPRSFS